MNEISGTGVRGAAIPPPDVDRGALSEAWYRALYGTRARSVTPPGTAEVRSGVAADAASGPPTPSRTKAALRANTLATNRNPARPLRTVAIVRADAARSERKIARPAPPEPRPATQRTACRVPLPDGSAVDLLVQRHGRRLRVVALVAGARANLVVAALHRARAALLTRGIFLDIDARAKGTSS